MSDKKIQKYYQWYEQEYGKVIHLDDLSKQADKRQLIWLKEAVEHFEYRLSSIWRHEVLTTMKYYVIPNKTDYICTIFKLNRFRSATQSNVQTTCAFLYSSVRAGKIIHEFVSACPTFTSADGEYRHRFITLEQYLDIYNKNKSVFELVEAHIGKQIKKKEVSLFSEVVCSKEILDNTKLYDELVTSIDRLRLPLLFYVTNWYIDYHRFREKILENHLTKGYTAALFSSGDNEFYKKNEEALQRNHSKISIKLQRFRKEPTQTFCPVEIGQKIIPLTVKQVENIGNIRYSTWSELYINSFVGDLVINGITPTFPIFNDWFLINGKTPNMYDNPIMHAKLHNSDIASGIIHDLEQTRKHTYLVDPTNKKEVFISYNMEGLSHAVEIPMDYAEEEMIMASHTLCTLTEHVGRTMADQPALIQNAKYANFIGPIFTSQLWLSKYMFEYLYGIYANNYRLGVIHGDLHLNNITIFAKRQAVPKLGDEPLFPNPSIIYNMHDELYIFPSTGRTSCIIDFSRSILSSKSPVLQKYKDNAISVPAAVESILSDQRHKIIKTYERELPEFYNAYKADIHAALIENYEAVFKIFTAIDAYKLSSGMLSMVQSRELREDIEKIRKMAHQYLTMGIMRVLKKQVCDPEKLEWPLQNIIKTLFTKYTVENFSCSEKITLIDYFSIDNAMEYNTRQYENFPPTVKFDYIIKHKIPIDQVGLQHYNTYVKKEKQKDLEMIKEIQENEIKSKPLRRGTPTLDLRDKKTAKKEAEKVKKILSESSNFYYDS
jgi:hypothetical protein